MAQEKQNSEKKEGKEKKKKKKSKKEKVKDFVQEGVAQTTFAVIEGAISSI